MPEEQRQRMRTIHQLEQLSSGLDNGEESSDIRARTLLARIVARGSCAVLAQVFRGILKEFDSEQADWDRILP